MAEDKYNLFTNCDMCSGSGIIKNVYKGGETYQDEPCPRCNGTGQLKSGEAIKA